MIKKRKEIKIRKIDKSRTISTFSPSAVCTIKFCINTPPLFILTATPYLQARATANTKKSIKMRSLNHRAPATELTSATSKYKRKHPFHKKRQYHHRKKQKSVSKIEKTLTLKPHNSNQNSVSLSNRFQSIQRKKSHNYDSNFEYNRKWTFSCHDSPAYEGIDFIYQD